MERGEKINYAIVLLKLAKTVSEPSPSAKNPLLKIIAFSHLITLFLNENVIVHHGKFRGHEIFSVSTCTVPRKVNVDVFITSRMKRTGVIVGTIFVFLVQHLAHALNVKL